MSFDLYFYKRKKQFLSEEEISAYLTKNLTAPNEDSTQWFFENKDTKVYFFFNHEECDDDPESIKSFESFNNFENTHFNFNLNFLRPNFFGLEAFAFVEKFANDLDLFILNPQSKADPDNPLKYNAGELLENWSKTNLRESANRFKELDLNFYPLDRSDNLWNYSYNRNLLQDKLGNGYFVPGIYFMKRKNTNDIISLIVWSEYLPILLPSVDFVLITKKYQRMLEVIEESGLVSYNTVLKNFGIYFDTYGLDDCKIIHPHKAKEIENLFNELKLEFILKEFCEPIGMDEMVNALPSTMG